MFLRCLLRRQFSVQWLVTQVLTPSVCSLYIFACHGNVGTQNIYNGCWTSSAAEASYFVIIQLIQISTKKYLIQLNFEKNVAAVSANILRGVDTPS